MQNDGYTAITVNMFFGKGISENGGNDFKSFDWTPFDLIVFDEVLLNNLHFLQLIKSFVEENQNQITIVANGDVNQLEPINLGLNNIENKSAYRMKAIKQIFPNIVELKEIKRLKSQSQKLKMKRIKKDISKGVPIKDICEKHGIKTISKMEEVETKGKKVSKMDEVETKRNIAYFNF